MRIVAGAARGRRLAVPPAGTRPTSDRVRESVFAALESAYGTLAGLRVLDLYAGSGALGLEALSRGAGAVTFVERDRRAAQVLRANVEAVGLPGAHVVVRDVVATLRSPPERAYDLVLADPPYDLSSQAVADVLEALTTGWLVDAARVLVERARGGEPAWPQGYRPLEVRRYGDTILAGALWYGRAARADPVPD